MIKLHGFDDYTTYFIYQKALGDPTFDQDQIRKWFDILFKIPNSILQNKNLTFTERNNECQNILTKINNGQVTELNETEIFYFDSHCSIPRNVLSYVDTYKKSNEFNCTIQVIPFIDINNFTIDSNYLIFMNRSKKIIYICYSLYEEASKILGRLVIGEQYTVLGDNNAEFIYDGPLLKTDFNKEYIFNYLDITPPRYIMEYDLLKHLSTPERMFTPEIIQTIISMATSSDVESRTQGLRVFASLDYMNYPISTSYIFASIPNATLASTPKNSTVKFLVNYYNKILSKNKLILGDNEKEIFQLLLDTELKNILENKISAFGRRFNTKINSNISLSIAD